MLWFLYHICFEPLGYELSDCKPLGSECMGSECERRFQTQFVYDAEPTPIGFGTLLHIQNPYIPNPNDL